jgi:Skp family chaperone for outer membrane proteins
MALLVLLMVPAAVAAETLGTNRVAVVNNARLFAEKGIARWVDARAKLDQERGTFKVVETPPGITRRNTPVPDHLSKERAERLRKRYDEIDRESVERQAWEKHESEVLDPIVANVNSALAEFAKIHKIGLVLDQESIGSSMLFLDAGVDITDAFIKHYNARTAAKPR